MHISSSHHLGENFFGPEVQLVCEVHSGMNSGVHSLQGMSHGSANGEGSPSTLPAVLTVQSPLGH